MDKTYKIIPYEDKYEQEWDRFIADDAVNGTFLHTRNFLNYHPKERFVDKSCLVFKGENLAAVVPGCVVDDGEKKVFSSHPGSTFGGPVIKKKYYYASNVIEIIKTLEDYLFNNGFQKCILKITPDLFCKENSNLLQYALSYCGYNSYSELSTYIDFDDYGDEIMDNFNGKQRNKLVQALRNNMTFKIIQDDDIIITFHNILQKNLLKFNAVPVHSIEDLLDFKNNRLKKYVEFFGVFLDGKMIAGGMMFKMDNVIHAQNLNADPDFLKYKVMPFFYYSVIKYAKECGYKKLSWGISTEKQGTILNESLIEFKESFGSKYSLNKGFYKLLTCSRL
jgi:hypothetical protein